MTQPELDGSRNEVLDVKLQGRDAKTDGGDPSGDLQTPTAYRPRDPQINDVAALGVGGEEEPRARCTQLRDLEASFVRLSERIGPGASTAFSPHLDRDVVRHRLGGVKPTGTVASRGGSIPAITGPAP